MSRPSLLRNRLSQGRKPTALLRLLLNRSSAGLFTALKIRQILCEELKNTAAAIMASQAGLAITVRFAASLPDLSLSVQQPQHTSVLSLICQVRDKLPSTHNTLRVRLIYAGRVLDRTSSIAAALRLPSSTVPSLPNTSERAKGKTPIRPQGQVQSTIYVHATFSDALATSSLEAHETEAKALDAALLPPEDLATTACDFSVALEEIDHASSSIDRIDRPSTDATIYNYASHSRAGSINSQAPQGFDRLLTAGLSPLEVASLRSQFVAILAHTHTPDMMPAAAELRLLEERWLDNDHDVVAGRGAAGGLESSPVVGEEDTGGLEDMLWGNVMGFFWPVGAVIWLMREEGVWTQRRRVAVVTGALVNLAFSIMRAAN